MPRKSFEAGMEAGAKPFEEKFKKQAEAIEKVGERMDKRLDSISEVMDVMLDDLSAQERKRVYDLNTVVDISELDRTEKEYLCAILYALANLNSKLNDGQKEYLRALRSYLMITDVQTDISLDSIENIDNITVQKAILQTVMEFLFLEYENHEYMDDYEDIFDYFSVNRKGIREIQDGIDSMHQAVGLEGIASHYSFLYGADAKQADVPDAKEDNMLDKAEKAYFSYDMKNALSLFTYLAEQENGRACYFLGELYVFHYDGVTKRDDTEAKKWRTLGAERGDILCRLNCAYSTDDAKEKETILKEMFPEVLALARQGDVYAMDEIASMFKNGNGVEQDMDKAKYWYSEAVNAGFWHSINSLGLIYFDNCPEKAVEYFRQAADLGNEYAMCNLAHCYKDGVGVEKDETKAVELYLKAAQKGHTNAQLWTGLSYDTGFKNFGTNKDNAEAVKWYRPAADAGDASACWNLALKLYEQSGENYPECLKYLMKGAELGYELCIVEAACWLCAKKGVTSKMLDEIGERTYGDEKIPETVVGMYLDLAKTLVTGWGSKSTDERERELQNRGKKVLEEYAEKGNRAAQYYLGVLYTDNMYLGKDKELARKWLRKAKDQGVRNAEDAYDVVSKSFWVLGPSLYYFTK